MMKAFITLSALSATLAHGGSAAIQSTLDGLSFDVFARDGGNPHVAQCQNSRVVINQPNRWCSTENVPTQNISVSECCGAYGQSVDRAVEASQAFCPESGCELSSNNWLEIALTLQSSATSGTCCTNCFCVGDPQCGLHKDGKYTEKIWITCDDRITSGKNMCRHDEQTCLAIKDDYGNDCTWIKKNNEDVGKYGSPCQPNEKSPKSKMVMYHGKKDDNEVFLELTLGERSIIEALTLRKLSNQTLTVASLSAKACFGNNARGRYMQQTDKPLDSQQKVEISNPEVVALYASDVWTSEEGESGLFMVKKVSFPNAMEVQYNVLEETLGLNFAVRCTSSATAPKEWSQQTLKDWTATIPRLDVISVLVPSKYTVEEEIGGFCVTGEIDIVRDDQRRRLGEKRSPFSAVSARRELKLGGDLHDKCLEKWQPSEMDACMAVDPTCVVARYAESVRSWCNACSYALQDTTDECVLKLEGERGRERHATVWRDYIAEMNKARQLPKQTKDDIAQFGYSAFFAKGFAGQLQSCISPTISSKACGELLDYSLREDVCVPGVSVEYFDDCGKGGEWKEALFIPSSLPPCNGKLSVPGGSTYDKLFKHAIRFSQRSISADCNEKTKCSSTPEFHVSFNFVQLENPTECVASESRCPVENVTSQDSPPVWSSHVSWKISETVRGHALTDTKGVFVFSEENQDGKHKMFEVDTRPLYPGFESVLCHSNLTLKSSGGGEEATINLNIVASVQKGLGINNRSNFHIWNADARSLMTTTNSISLDNFNVESIECKGNMIYIGGEIDGVARVEYFEIPSEVSIPGKNDTKHRRRLGDSCTEITKEDHCKGSCMWEAKTRQCGSKRCKSLDATVCKSQTHCLLYHQNSRLSCTDNTIGDLRVCGSIEGKNPQVFYGNALFTFDLQETKDPTVYLHTRTSNRGDADPCSIMYESLSQKEIPGVKAKFAMIDGNARTPVKFVKDSKPTLALVEWNQRSINFYTIEVWEKTIRSISAWESETKTAADKDIVSYDLISLPTDAGNDLLLSKPSTLYFAYGMANTLKVKKISDSKSPSEVSLTDNTFDSGVESVMMYLDSGKVVVQAAGGIKEKISGRFLTPGSENQELGKGKIRIFVLGNDTQVGPPIRSPPTVLLLPIKPKPCDYLSDQSPPICINELLSMVGESEECEESCLAQMQPKSDRDQVIAQVMYPFATNATKADLVNARAVVNLQFNVHSYPPCCQYCSCWGDPECVAFGNKPSEYVKWVVCDSRSTPDGEKCVSSQSTCLNTVDHKGNLCEWKDRGAEAKPNLVSYYGHSCQPNWDISGPAGMTMYKTVVNNKNMSVGLQMGERGVIRRLMIRLADVRNGWTFALDHYASGCFDVSQKGSTYAPGFNSSTTFPSEYFETKAPPKNRSLKSYTMGPFTLQEEYLDELSKTQTLRISEDLDFAISMEILCTRFKGKNGDYGGARLRVNLFDTRMEPGEQHTGSGFCVSNRMDGHLPREFDSWIPVNSTLAISDIPQFESPELKGACFDQVPKDNRICSGITGKPCERQEVLQRAKSWCESTSSSCANIFKGREVNLKKWVEEFCKSKSSCLSKVFHSNVRTCVNEIFNDSEEAFKKLEVCSNNLLSKSCAASVIDYPRSALDSCTQGISVQTSIDGATWKTEFFVPDTLMPCNGVLTVSAEDIPSLFSHYVRYLREDIDFNICRATRPETSCDSRPRFRVNYTYSAQACDLARFESTSDSIFLAKTIRIMN